MALGVLVAYGIFRAGFALMRPQKSRPAMKASTKTANVV